MNSNGRSGRIYTFVARAGQDEIGLVDSVSVDCLELSGSDGSPRRLVLAPEMIMRILLRKDEGYSFYDGLIRKTEELEKKR